MSRNRAKDQNMGIQGEVAFACMAIAAGIEILACKEWVANAFKLKCRILPRKFHMDFKIMLDDKPTWIEVKNRSETFRHFNLWEDYRAAAALPICPALLIEVIEPGLVEWSTANIELLLGVPANVMFPSYYGDNEDRIIMPHRRWPRNAYRSGLPWECSPMVGKDDSIGDLFMRNCGA